MGGRGRGEPEIYARDTGDWGGGRGEPEREMRERLMVVGESERGERETDGGGGGGGTENKRRGKGGGGGGGGRGEPERDERYTDCAPARRLPGAGCWGTASIIGCRYKYTSVGPTFSGVSFVLVHGLAGWLHW